MATSAAGRSGTTDRTGSAYAFRRLVKGPRADSVDRPKDRILLTPESSISGGGALVDFPHESEPLSEHIDQHPTSRRDTSTPVESETIEHLRWKVHGKYGGFRATPREGEILSLLAAGQGDKEIGARLKISPRTVQMHLRNLCRRNLVRNRAEATALWTTAQCDRSMTPLTGIPEGWREDDGALRRRPTTPAREFPTART